MQQEDGKAGREGGVLEGLSRQGAIPSMERVLAMGHAVRSLWGVRLMLRECRKAMTGRPLQTFPPSRLPVASRGRSHGIDVHAGAIRAQLEALLAVAHSNAHLGDADVGAVGGDDRARLG